MAKIGYSLGTESDIKSAMTVRYIFVHFYKQYHREMVQVNAITTKKSTASYICEEEDDLRLRLTAVETEQT